MRVKVMAPFKPKPKWINYSNTTPIEPGEFHACGCSLCIKGAIRDGYWSPTVALPHRKFLNAAIRHRIMKIE